MGQKRSSKSEFEKKMAKVDEIIGRYRNTLRELADTAGPAQSEPPENSPTRN
jgi:hypothetical protein